MSRVIAVVVMTVAGGLMTLGCSGGRGISGVNNHNNGNANQNAGCGNDVLDPGEQCDTTDLGGATCETLGYAGGGLVCALNCTFYTAGCEIPPGCGNGLLDPNEQCDGNNLGGETCEALGYTGGTLACREQCVFDTAACESEAVCGDGVVGFPEQCDVSNLAGESCVSLGYAAGDLSCNPNCAFDLSACIDEVCGNGVAESTEDCDGSDLAGATCTQRGYAGGALACDPGCGFDVTACLDQVCGNAIAEGSEDCDGADLGDASCTSLGFLSGTLSCDGSCGYDTGLCVGPCAAAAQANSQFGCEFWAVDLPQWQAANDYVIALQNPSATDTATVTLTSASGVTLATLTVLPSTRQLYTDSLRTLNVSGAGILPNGIHVTSDLPIAVAQFNELGTNFASTDTSLLIPLHGLGTRYYAMDYTARVDDDSYVAVVATQPQTTVTLFATASVSGATTAVLDAGDVMVVTAANQGASLTGSRIEADLPVAVFSGNVCANVPTGVSFCDHLEEQIFPRRVLGTSYALGKSAPRTGCDPADRIRVLADADLTTVTFDPPVVGPWSGDAGDWTEVALDAPVHISANNPVMVAQFLAGPGSVPCNAEGDPAFILHAPLSQLTDELTVSVPSSFAADYLSIVAPLGATLTIDSVAVTTAQTQIGASSWFVSLVNLTDGFHHITSSQPISVTAYGIEGAPTPQYVSYGHPAGLVFDTINPVE